MSYPQNDPDRAGGLISDAQGEFVQEESGGAFDPRAFRASQEEAGGKGDESGEPPMDNNRMVGPREEIDKAH